MPKTSDSTSSPASRSALVVGGSSGLGWHVAARLVRAGYAVTITGRTPEKLQAAVDSIRSTVADSETASKAIPADIRAAGRSPATVRAQAGDATNEPDVQRWVDDHVAAHGGLDVLVNVVGKSDRGRLDTLSVKTLEDLLAVNVRGPLLCSQAALPELRLRRGVIVNIGSLASRLTPRYMGGYITAKHALAGMTRQLRLELESEGVHVGLICPGPIAGEQPSGGGDSATRYDIRDRDVPQAAAAPGGGAKLKGLSPEKVADAVLRCIQRREIEVVMPRKVRWLIALNALSPSLADRILGSRTS